jgi:hypothetical protein
MGVGKSVLYEKSLYIWRLIPKSSIYKVSFVKARPGRSTAPENFMHIQSLPEYIPFNKSSYLPRVNTVEFIYWSDQSTFNMFSPESKSFPRHELLTAHKTNKNSGRGLP